MQRYEGPEQEMRAVMAGLRGMVVDLSGGGLDFRPAEPGEKPLNHGQRRQLARYRMQGLSDDRVREVIESW